MLKVDLRDIANGPVDTTGRLEPDDAVFEGLGLPLLGPVDVSGQLLATGTEEYLWRGHLRGQLQVTCRRCLTEVTLPLDAAVDVMFSADPDAADDPSVYPVPAPITHVDVRSAVREEIAFVVPAFVLCREDCKGLCQRCGADLNAGPCGCTAAAEPV